MSWPFPAARALPGSGPSPSSKAEPGGVVVRQGSFQTPLTGRVNCVRFVCNWKHNSCRSVFFTQSVCPEHCRVHRRIFNIFFFFSLYSSWVILGQTYHICKTFQSTWMYRGASKDAETLGFSRRIAFYSLLWTMLNDGFVSIMFGWSWLWVPVDNIFYIHPLQLLLVGQSGWNLFYPTNAGFCMRLGVVAWIRPFVLINAFFRY